MRILVTGASGRIGRNLCRALIQRGETVVALVLPGDPNRELLAGLGVECITGDLAEYAAITPALQGVEAIYHLGALLPQGVNAFQLFEANLRGTFHLLEAVAQAGSADKLQRFIFASTDATYPSGAQFYLPIDESHPQQPNSFYGFTKEAGERMCLTYARQYGIPLVRPRFTFTIEAQELLNPQSVAGPLFFLQARLKQLRASAAQGSAAAKEAVPILESLQQADTEQLVIVYGPDGAPERMTLCDVRDLVPGLLLLLDNPVAVGDTFNLGPPAGFTLDQAVKAMSSATGLPYVEARLPLSPMCFEVSSAKARTMLGYQPRLTVFDMIESAAQQWRQ